MVPFFFAICMSGLGVAVLCSILGGKWLTGILLAGLPACHLSWRLSQTWNQEHIANRFLLFKRSVRKVYPESQGGVVMTVPWNLLFQRGYAPFFLSVLVSILALLVKFLGPGDQWIAIFFLTFPIPFWLAGRIMTLEADALRGLLREISTQESGRRPGMDEDM